MAESIEMLQKVAQALGPLLDAAPGHLGGDAVAYQRADIAVKAMRQIVEIGQS